MIVYHSKRGILEIPGSASLWKAYSGNGEAMNDPHMQSVRGHGPIPAGDWQIGAWEDYHQHLGAQVVHLEPAQGTEAFGRSGFFIHGDNWKMNETGSDGCIVASRQIRDLLRASGATILRVAPD